MRPSFLAAGPVLAGLFAFTGPSAVSATDGYDNPTMGAAPCIVLNRYESNPLGKRGAEVKGYRARADIENICGRSLQVSFCFLYAEPVDGANGHCVDELLRPWSNDSLTIADAPARVTGPDYRWRYIPVN